MRENTSIKPPYVFATLFVVVLSLLCFQNSFGQNAQNIKTFAEVQKALQNNSADYSKLVSLLSDEQPSIYILNSTEKVYGSEPVVLYTDLDNLSSIESGEFGSDSIELIRIAINDSQNARNKISQNIFKRFTKLKYIYFLLENDMPNADVQGLIDLTNTELIVFYQIIKRS